MYRIFSILSPSFWSQHSIGHAFLAVLMLALHTSDSQTSAYSGLPTGRCRLFGETCCFSRLPSLASCWERLHWDQRADNCCDTGRRVYWSLRMKHTGWKPSHSGVWVRVLSVDCAFPLQKDIVYNIYWVAQYLNTSSNTEVLWKSCHAWKGSCGYVFLPGFSLQGPVSLRISREQSSWKRPSLRTERGCYAAVTLFAPKQP